MNQSPHPAFRGLVLLLSCLLIAGAARAEAPRQYEIELLVFQHLINSDNGEIWPVDYSEWLEEPLPASGSGNAMLDKVSWLPAQAYRLTAERNALGRSSQYRPLAYLAWRQTVVDRDDARAVRITPTRAVSGSYIDGTVRVAVERYLHLYLDLQLHVPGSAAGQADNVAYELPEIRLTEHRRMRSKEVHYFDNPRFGVIALITPFQPAAEKQP